MTTDDESAAALRFPVARFRVEAIMARSLDLGSAQGHARLPRFEVKPLVGAGACSAEFDADLPPMALGHVDVAGAPLRLKAPKISV